MRKSFSLLILFFFLTLLVKANNYEQIIEVLKYVESNNNPASVGDDGKAFGVLQIHKICVDDVNRYWGTNYTHEQMFKESCAEEVTKLYMKMGEILYFKKYGVKPTEEVLVRSHNGGIYQGYRIEATEKYYIKYLKMKSKIINLNLN